ncbi:uncharacterized protein ASCRUDRAFT_8542 [Ascoidea rubescens DSM 1968]|uniref:Uncharacterized protein n=1 Tax=Ascoidea rubescens DSM 1968 TaxID=1344418 RepID=A0A1D2VF78_9ASCO|nr:hypothetical protein ASCRUDRAFT_8542 [Ascoidea rubescens DSM 1968]ODV60286.1 hypothetical protein ASCRUDRAFT_8542 [Ascoidea rubescens DSM 1968]
MDESASSSDIISSSNSSAIPLLSNNSVVTSAFIESISSLETSNNQRSNSLTNNRRSLANETSTSNFNSSLISSGNSSMEFFTSDTHITSSNSIITKTNSILSKNTGGNSALSNSTLNTTLSNKSSPSIGSSSVSYKTSSALFNKFQQGNNILSKIKEENESWERNDNDIQNIDSPSSDIIYGNLDNPHEPPHPINLNGQKSLKQAAADRHSSSIFPNDDIFTTHMEERLLRWRPPSSQNNVDDALNGKHPYQLNYHDDNPNSQVSLQKTPAHFYSSGIDRLKSVFTNKNQSKNDINSNSSTSQLNSPNNPETGISQFRVTFNETLSIQEIRQNSPVHRNSLVSYTPSNESYSIDPKRLSNINKNANCPGNSTKSISDRNVLNEQEDYSTILTVISVNSEHLGLGDEISSIFHNENNGLRTQQPSFLGDPAYSLNPTTPEAFPLNSEDLSKFQHDSDQSTHLNSNPFISCWNSSWNSSWNCVFF